MLSGCIETFQSNSLKSKNLKSNILMKNKLCNNDRRGGLFSIEYYLKINVHELDYIGRGTIILQFKKKTG